MNNRTRLRQFIVLSLVLWVFSGGLAVVLTIKALSLFNVGLLVVSIAAAAASSMLMLNQSQNEVSEANKSHSHTKRQVQEFQLKVDRFEYDSKKASELRRIVLNSTQEKDHSLRNMASALDYAMNEIVELSTDHGVGTLDQIRARANGMKRYAADLQALAKLELKTELPEHVEVDFLKQLELLIDQWNKFGKERHVKVRLDSREDQMPIFSDQNWIENLMSRVVHSLIRMNENTQLDVHLIGYLDADIGDALRMNITIDGRVLSDMQINHLMSEYVSIVEDGIEVGPGLTFVVVRRLAQMLNGFIEVSNGTHGLEVLVVLPRNPGFSEKEEPQF